MAKPNMSVARVVKLNASSVGKSERHNERKNTNYKNVNVVPERIPFNVSFKSPGDMTYNEYFDHLVAEGKISTRGLKDGATYFNEMIIDVNTAYFEEHGGYEFAKEFYEEAYRFCCEIYGEDQIVSAVMHADEINSAVSEELGKPVYWFKFRKQKPDTKGPDDLDDYDFGDDDEDDEEEYVIEDDQPEETDEV